MLHGKCIKYHDGKKIEEAFYENGFKVGKMNG